MEILMIAIVLGVARGGKIANLLKSDFRGVSLFAVVLLLTFTVYKLLDPGSFLVQITYVVCFILVLVGLYLNRKISGIWIAFFGVCLNLLVILCNGFKMPVTNKIFVWISELEFAGSSQSLTHSIIASNTNLEFLADIFLIPPGHFASGVYSLGDLLLYGGVILAVVSIMCGSKEEV